MGQVARPVADVANQGWSPTPVYGKINEVQPDTATWVSSSGSAGDRFVVKLGGVAWPADGPRVLKVTLRKTAGGVLFVVVDLMQGDVVVATRILQLTTSFETRTIVLTPAEVDQI